MFRNREPEPSPLLARALEIVKLRGVTLSRNSQELLALASRAWVEEHPRLKAYVADTPQAVENLAEVIFLKALTDPHIEADQRNFDKVRFSSLLFSLARAGEAVLAGLMDEGFK